MRPARLFAYLLALAVFASVSLQAQNPTRVMGAPYASASRAFIDVMIPHHETALMMSQHAVAEARSDAVKELARKMVESQTAEIAELKAARRALFGSDSARRSMMGAMMQMMMGMHQMGDSGAPRVMKEPMRAMPDSMRMMPDSMRMVRDSARAMPDSVHMMPDSMRMRPTEPAHGEQHVGAMMPGMMAGMMSGNFDRMFLERMISHHRDGVDISLLAEHSDAGARVRQLAKKTREAQERDIAEMRRILATLPTSPPAGRRP